MQAFCHFMAFWHFCQKANCITKSAFSRLFHRIRLLDFPALILMHWYWHCGTCTWLFILERLFDYFVEVEILMTRFKISSPWFSSKKSTQKITKRQGINIRRISLNNKIIGTKVKKMGLKSKFPSTSVQNDSASSLV